MMKGLPIPFYIIWLWIPIPLAVTIMHLPLWICPLAKKNLDEKPNKSFLYNLVMDPYSFGYTAPGIQTNLNQQAFQAIYDTVKMIGENGPCVIVGRCADYALAENKNSLHLFIYSSEREKINRIMKKYDFNEK